MLFFYNIILPSFCCALLLVQIVQTRRVVKDFDRGGGKQQPSLNI